MLPRGIYVTLLLLICFFNTCKSQSTAKDPYAQQPRIVAIMGNLFFRAAENRSIYFSYDGNGKIMINKMDVSNMMNQMQTFTRQFANSMRNVEIFNRRLTTLQNQVRSMSNLAAHVDQLEENVTALSSTIDSFIGRGQERLSNRGLRRIARKVSSLGDQVRRLTQLLSSDECASNPCRNGGTCVDQYNGFLCRCPTNWEGPVCDTDVNECAIFAGTDLGCQNGATCYNSPGSYRCQCQPNWYGIHCTERHDDCSTASHQELCGHGTCINEARVQPGQSKFRCICDSGWQQGRNGPACTEDVDECAGSTSRCSRNPPVPCYNFPGSFHCGPCPSGYTGNGYSCADINECEVNNGGCSISPYVQCSNTIGSRACGPCPPGFIGNGIQCTFAGICSINHGGCHPLATCTENSAMSATYRECRCPPGYAGNGEGLNGCVASAGTSCADNPCQHGSCQVISGRFHCSCYPGYTGSLCDQMISPCYSNPCNNGGTCVAQAGGFTCMCSEQYEGATCDQEKPGCGAHFLSDNGTLEYPPSYGQEYGHQQNCLWLITVDERKVLNITFNRMHLEHGPNCEYDFLQINDGPSAVSHSLARLCGDYVEQSILSNHNEVYVWFHSDHTVAGMGFSFTWNAVNVSCGGELPIADYGAINSPGYPGKYPKNRDCYWLVKVPLGKRIQFHFATLQLEEHENCSYDYLKIIDGANENDPVLQTYCTTQTPAPMISSASFALLHFHSDGSVQDTGFHITYAAVAGIPGCGGLLTSPSGVITSPNFPDVYENSLICEWLIRIHPQDKIKLTFSNFSVEQHRNCEFDYLEIYDGSSDAAPIHGRFCGEDMPPDLISNSNQLFIKFQTDTSVRRNGFRLQYVTICGGTYTGLSGSFSTPYFPDPYPASITCFYQISVPVGYLISLEFPMFDIEGHESCVFDTVEVREGISEDGNLIGQYCGATPPDPITSTFNELSIKFVSDGSVQNHGFFANYSTTNVGCGGVMRNNSGIIRSPMHPNFYPPSVTCTWIIQAPPGYIIRLTFETFIIEHHENCDFDYVFIKDSNGAKIGKYCGDTVPPMLTSSENKMTIIFVADESVFREGFNASCSFLDATQTCGGDYYVESGVIRSPGYPQNYHHNRNCVWILHAENGHQIVLNFTVFELEQHNNCNFDYLEIRNGGYSTSPLMNRYCGTTIPPLITSHSNILRMVFQSDGSQSAKGFEIFFDSATTGCGGTLSTPSGTIVSPNYPEPYGHNAECTWLIRVSAGSVISVVIIDIDIEEHHACDFDFLQIFDGNSDSARSLVLMCNNQQNPGPITSSSNVLFIKFRSDFSGTGRGFHLTYVTSCNNVLKKRQGIIESPNFPNTYPHNHNCTWTIEAPLGNNISLAFSHLFMENGNCENDYVEVLEVRDEQPVQLGKYCGTPESAPPYIETITNIAKIRLITDAYVSREGFRLQYAVKGCGGDTTRYYGYITSPNYPNAYPHGTECYWNIKYEPGTRVKLIVSELDMEGAPGCMFDFLKVFDGEDENSEVLLNLCHKITTPQTVASHGNAMVVHFRSDRSIAMRGFRATYQKVHSGCGGLLTASESIIMSPNFPVRYNTGDQCSWLIQVDPSHLVALEFYEFSLPSSANCTEGYVAAYDGKNTSVPLLMKSCGELPANTAISSTGNVMLLVFKALGTSIGKGFKAHYKAGCGQRITASVGGEITSPNYPYTAPNHDNCSWIIQAPDSGEHVMLTITHLQFMSENCEAFLEVRDGDQPDSPVKGKFCNNRAPPAIVSDGNTLHVSLFRYGIFRAVYGIASSYCGGTYISESGSFTSPDFPSNYPIDAECVWIIQAAAGNKVQISFQSFNLEESDYCNMDYIEIRENDAGGSFIGRYCGSRIPNNMTAAHKLWIKFRSDNEGTSHGFILSYSLLHGTQLNGTEGIIESPGYPTFTYTNVPYIWIVTVPDGLFISVRFLEIEIMSFRYESCEISVQVFDGVDDNAPLLGEFCGYSYPEPVVSHGNQITIKYSGGTPYMTGHWRLQWVAVNETSVVTKPSNETGSTPACWNEVYLNSSQITEIKSEGYPDQFHDRVNCTWIVRSSMVNHIRLTVLGLILDGSRSYCMLDRIYIYTAPNPSVDVWNLNTTLCGRHSLDLVIDAPTNLLKIVFTSGNTGSFSGFHFKVETACGNIITGDNGVIRSSDIAPYFSQETRNFVCDWMISVKPRRTIKLTFNELNLLSDSLCTNNYFMLLNGGKSTSPVLGNGRYCGNTIPSVPETSSNQVFIRIGMSSITRGLPVFVLQFREIGLTCGGHLFVNEFNKYLEIQSPNYPNPPQHEIECSWIILSPPGTKLRIDFNDQFSMSQNCFYVDAVEYVELFDGGTELSEPLGKFCGNVAPSSVFTTGNALYVHYFMQAEHALPGFKAKIQTAECGGILSNFNGALSTPDYPKNYSSSMECEWLLKLPLGYHINLVLSDLDTPFSQNCSLTDYIEIREYDANGEVIGMYCGSFHNRINGTYEIDTASHQAYVKFKSNNAITGRGFRLEFSGVYDAVCGSTFYGASSGVITSPNYPSALMHPRECIWRILAPEGRLISITFNEFNIPKDENTDICISGLQVLTSYQYRGVRTVNYYCGSELPDPIEVSTSTVYLRFFTHGLLAGQGFSLTFSTEKESICGGLLPVPTGILASPNFTFPSNASVECKWNINMDSYNQTLAIKFDILDIPGHVANYCRESSIAFVGRPGQYIGKYCGNFTDKRPLFTTAYNQVQIYFYANLSVPFAGFHASYKVNDCGGVVNGRNAVITSIGYPNNYPPNTDCHWIIRVPFGENIKLTVVDLRLENDCEKDYVIIRDGNKLKSPLIGKFCGTVSPAPMTSNFYVFSVIFHSDEYGGAPGFNITTEEVERGCGGVMHSTQGTIKSTNYPNHYPNNIECVWTIELTPGHKVNISFVDRFDIEMDDTCSRDYILIEDFDDGIWHEVGKKCGREKPQSVVSTSTKMRITFHTNEQIQGDGFHIEYSEACGGHFTDKKGAIFSPNYPELYGDNLNCKYLIGYPEHYLRLTFDQDKFSVEGSDDCRYDYITIYDGNTTSAPSRGKYCGNIAPPVLNIKGQILVEFQTDFGYAGHGFIAHYEILDCGGNLTSPSGIIESPSHPEEYFNNMHCNWFIQGQENRVIAIRFISFDVEGSSNCVYDGLIITEGNSTGNVIAKLCGNSLPPTVKSASNRVTVKFRTDSYVTGKGFKAVYYNTFGVAQGCGGTLTQSSGEISSFDFDKDGKYEPNLDCVWHLIGTSDQILKLVFSSFDVESSTNGTCRYDFVEVRDGISGGDPVIGRFCGSTIPSNITASSNKLTILFHTDGEENKAGFRISFNSVPTICGPALLFVRNTSQNLTSPNYPAAYPPNLWCRWHFVTNVSEISNDKVLITFFDIDIPCDGSYLEVSSHEYVDKPYRLCGPNKTHSITASSGLWLSLHTGTSQSGRGISLSYKIGDCNETYTADNGLIASHKFSYYSRRYPDCVTYIKTAIGRTISLYFNNFDFFSFRTLTCENTNVKVYDGNNTSSPLLANICRQNRPNPVFSSSNEMLLIFKSVFPQAQYTVSYTTTNKGKGCGGTLSQVRGTFSSPLYPQAYNVSAECTWILSVPGRHTMTLEFVSFALNSTSGCDMNYVEIYEGTESTRMIRVNRLCGSDQPAPYGSQGSELTVKYVTDTTNIAPGFLANFVTNNQAERDNISVIQSQVGPVTLS